MKVSALPPFPNEQGLTMLDPCADGVRFAYPLYQAEGSGETPTSALQLRLVEVTVDTARALNRLWHSTRPRTSKTNLDRTRKRVCYAADCGGIYYAVAIWTDPACPTLSRGDWLELRRLAVAPDAPKNTCTRMLRIMAMLLRRKYPDVTRLISYQATATHAGTIYRAAGWEAAQRTKFSQWDRPRRARRGAQQVSDTVRWEKGL